MKRFKIAVSVASIAIIAAFVFAASPDSQSGTQSFAHVITKKLTVKNAATFQDAVTFEGVVDCNGLADCVVLDTDGDTTLSAPTDDQIDIELGGADQLVVKAVAAADSGTTNEYTEIAFTTPADTTGTNTHNALTLDLAIGNSATTGTHIVRAVQIDSISADTDVDETAINVGSGWDIGIDLGGTPQDLDADNDTSIAANVDDQIDFEVSGSDVFRISAMGPVMVEASVIAVTASTTITPTAPYQPITSTAEFTASATTAISDGTLTGQVVCLVNENASDVIHIPDGANTNISSQADLGNDDVLCVLWDGADWLEISQVNN